MIRNGGKMDNLTIISRRMKHHSKYSGYDRLADYLDGEVINPPEKLTVFNKLTALSLRPLVRRSGNQWYHRVELINELSAMRRWVFRKGHVFHFLYGENSYRYLGALKSMSNKNRIVCTYHTPCGKFHDNIKSHGFLNHIDALIVVSTIQLAFFSRLIDKERIFYIPHGVDVDYYRPAATQGLKEYEFECLFVGSHLRDMDTLSEAAGILKKLDPDVHLTVVTSEEMGARIAHHENISVRSGVSDNDLLQLYQRADLFFMPLLDCTANNALLEAMACGLPVVTTDLPGVKDYVNGECACLEKKGDAMGMAESVLTLKRDKEKRDRMGRASRARADAFAWERVAEDMAKVYREIA